MYQIIDTDVEGFYCNVFSTLEKAREYATRYYVKDSSPPLDFIDIDKLNQQVEGHFKFVLLNVDPAI